MKTTVVLCGIGVALLLGSVAGAQHSSIGVGAKYGSHDPRVCPTRTEPVNGPISAAQATMYFICATEKEMHYGAHPNQLYLVDEVKLKVEESLPYKTASLTFPSLRMIGNDRSQQVYRIEGSYKFFICDAVGSDNRGRNCTVALNTANAGICYKNKTQEWRCFLQPRQNSTIEDRVPPPK